MRYLIPLLLLISAYYFDEVSEFSFVSYGGEQIIRLVDLPDNKQFQNIGGENIDIGYIFKSVELLYIPIWQYSGRLAGYTGEDNAYLPLEKSDIDELLKQADMQLPEAPYLDFWHRIGGKLLVAFIFILFVVISLSGIRLRRG